MAGNVEQVENKKIVISKRFKDENGNPLEWEIRAITAEENEAIQKKDMVNVPIPGQRNQFERFYSTWGDIKDQFISWQDLNDSKTDWKAVKNHIER